MHATRCLLVSGFFLRSLSLVAILAGECVDVRPQSVSIWIKNRAPFPILLVKLPHRFEVSLFIKITRKYQTTVEGLIVFYRQDLDRMLPIFYSFFVMCLKLPLNFFGMNLLQVPP